MLTREVSEMGKSTQLALFSFCSAASTTPHIYSAQQTIFALTPGPHLPDAASHSCMGGCPLETAGTTRTFPWHIPAETCCYRCSASTTAVRGTDLPSFLTCFFCSCLLKPHHLFKLWLGGLLCCHLSGSHNVPTTASTSWSHKVGTRGRGAKSFSGLMCGPSSEAKQRSQQSAAKTETSALFFS